MARQPLKNEIKPVKPHLTRGSGGLAGEVLDVRQDLERCMDRIEDEFPLIEQSDRYDLWINYATGDDANDGLTEAKAVKTVKRLAALIPKMIATEFFVVNVRGGGSAVTLTQANNAGMWFKTMRRPDGSFPKIIISGENGVVTHLDNGSGGNIVSDINAAGEIGLTTATWTENEHRGYWCEIKTGVLAGETFTVDHNDGTKLYLMDCDTDPGAGAEFILTKPATEVAAGPFWMGEDQGFAAILDGPGELYMQNLYFTGGAAPSVENTQNLATSGVMVSHCIIKGDMAFFGIGCDGGGIIFLDNFVWDVSTAVPTGDYTGIGVSISQYPVIPALFIYCSGVVNIGSALIPEMHVWYCKGAFQCYESSIHATWMMCSKVPGHGGGSFGGFAFWSGKPTRFGGHRAFGVPTPDLPAIEMFDSEADFAKSKIVDSTMALRMVASKAILQSPTGNDHTVAGVHADASSFIGLVPNTPPPTLEGNSVELSKDGTTELSTWLAIQGAPATGTITVVAKANLVNNDSFDIGGTTFEYNVDNGTFTPTGGGVVVIDVNAATTDVEVAVATAAAINDEGIGVTCPTPTTAVITVSADVYGTGGNAITLAETVADAGFLVSGATLTGGTNPVPVSDIEVISKPYVPMSFTFPV